MQRNMFFTKKYTISVLALLIALLPSMSLLPNMAQINAIATRYNAIPCTNQSLIEKFNQMQDSLQIKEKISLFVSSQTPSYLSPYATAYYNKQYYDNKQHHAIILMPLFFQLTQTVQEFTLYHELRHYIQQISPQVQKVVANIAQTYNISTDQADEHDADLTALEYITKRNCSTCLQEIHNKTVLDSINDHTKKGYITTKVVNLFLTKIQKNHISCMYHKTLS